MFQAYLNPHFVVAMAGRFLSCFCMTPQPTAEPSPWVQRWQHLIRPGGTVLDLACGSGRHVRWLANKGFMLTGVDRDAAMMAPLRGMAEIIVADVEQSPWPLAQRRFDAIVVTNYLWRPLWPNLHSALAAGGVLLYETFADGQQSVGRPARPEFLLQRGELLHALTGLRLVAFEDGFIESPGRFVQRAVAVLSSAANDASPARYPL